MHAGTLRALEFDRIVSVVAGLAVTPPGRDRLTQLHPLTDPAQVIATLRATTEGVRFLADYPGFPLRAPSDLQAILESLNVDGRALEPLRLLGLAEYLESVEQSRNAVQKSIGFPILAGLVATAASFKGEIADVRRKIDPSGDVADNATPALASIRERLRRQKAKLRSTLDSFVRGRDTSKYLQDQVVTDRNGRFVLMVRAEHRHSIPGIVHGGSASGASLYVEPLETIEVNNDIVALEEQEAEEVRRILLALTDNFRGRPDDLARTVRVATELDVIQARARLSQMVGGIEPGISQDGSFELHGARHPLLMGLVFGAGAGRRSPVRAQPDPRHHGTEHRRQDGRAQDGRPVRRDGTGRTPSAGRNGFPASGFQVDVCRHRRRAVDLRKPQHLLGPHHQCGVDGSQPAAPRARSAR